MSTDRAPRSAEIGAGWTLLVDANCCCVLVRFSGAGAAVQHHAAECRHPDHGDVARIVGQAVADVLGHPVAVAWGLTP